jgi:hypothetical protein
MAAYPRVTHHRYGYGYTLGPKMATRYSYPYPHHGYGLLTGTGPGTAKNTRGLPVQITTLKGLLNILPALSNFKSYLGKTQYSD